MDEIKKVDWRTYKYNKTIINKYRYIYSIYISTLPMCHYVRRLVAHRPLILAQSGILIPVWEGGGGLH